MRATVRRCFCDKERSLSFYGEGMEYEGSEARVRELTSLGYLEPSCLQPVECGEAPSDETAEAPGPGSSEAAQAGQEETLAEPAEEARKASAKAATARKPPQKKSAPRAAAKKVSAGGGLRDKI